MRMRQFQPYWTPHARSNEHINAEAGPSTLAPPLVAPLTIHPSGGSPETTADAENNEIDTEEDEAPVSNFYCSHVPRVTERLSTSVG